MNEFAQSKRTKDIKMKQDALSKQCKKLAAALEIAQKLVPAPDPIAGDRDREPTRCVLRLNTNELTYKCDLLGFVQEWLDTHVQHKE